MIEGSRRLSQRHITIRVPWHDSAWNGHVCNSPSSNTSCLVLARIASGIRENRDEFAGRSFESLDRTDLPPCVEERGGFMYDHDLTLLKSHPYKLSSPDTHGHFGQTPLRLEAYAAACIPFGWMLRRQVEGDQRMGEVGKAHALKLGYEPAREPELSFDTSWIQDRHNQLIMLDTFFGALKPESSLCFFYAKRTPLSENSRRVIVGVGRLKGIGQPTDYLYDRDGDLKGVLWERNIRHSIRPDQSDGFLMPYTAVLAAAEANSSFPLDDCIAFAPDDQFESFSYASEHLTHDGAIASLLACVKALKVTAENVGIPVQAQLAWLDQELGRLWKARGVHPGLGSALTAFGLEHGALLAHEIERAGSRDGEVFNALAFIDTFAADPKRFPQAEAFGFGASFREKWRKLPSDRRSLFDLIARCELTTDQADRAYQPSSRKAAGLDVADADILANPYVLFEKDEAAADRIPFSVLDRGVFPIDAVRALAPLTPPIAMTDAIDRRRVRGLVVELLEEAIAHEGHTLLPRSWVVRRALDAPLEPKCAADEDVLAMGKGFIDAIVSPGQTIAGEPTFKLKRYATAKTMIAVAVRKRVGGRVHELSHPWRKLVDAEFDRSGAKDKTLTEDEVLARDEKTAALEQIACARFSVLIGPAGSGKTTLLKILCDLPEIRSSVLLLAPTGKARVRLEEATQRLGQGQTLAQFLQRLKRYEGDSGRYFWNPEAPREKSYRTIIVDECSMLTEDQLAALFDAVEGVERIVLVGDPRQLPPIGAGRPFVDICRHLAPPPLPPIFPRLARGYAELTIMGRQRGAGRGDVLLARQFSGEPLDAGADEVWDRLREGHLDHVRAVHWSGPAVVRDTLNAELVTELALADAADEAGFEASLGAAPFGTPPQMYFWSAREVGGKDGAASKSHDWQVLSPVRAGLAGVDALNLSIQQRFRTRVRAMAESTQWWTKIPKPAGPQALLWGDKVINVRNNGRRRTYPLQDKAYVANGDIGVIVGGYKTKTMKRRPRDLDVEFQSQTGIKFTYPAWEFRGDDGSPELELAYALTVHKTQGSQFGRTLLVLPRNCRPLSREMLYTALTRQQDHIVLLHEDEIGALQRYTHPSTSEIARRMTDLFADPEPIEVVSERGLVFLEQGLIHRTSRNELVRSKAELAIAEKLNAMGVPYVYEQPLKLGEKTRYPDFTIEDDDAGITYYWEHLGLLVDPDYARRWEIKRQAYFDAGVRTIEDRGNADRILITTREVQGSGLDMLAIERLATIILNGAP
ncbi:RNA helicase [Rhizobium leguminosarum bv. viciae]|nr:AAA family ATPase [Rhizobium leguminosarum]TAW70099.1 RNA helicase [Rhizobium ruizarguesonis]TBY23232.1 RNA helicase [Rhizobium leguminosarum bv. viciae]MBY5481264.1 AAA family ATPase [Rhizobium leguminosarum]TAY27335.1 RNA helicase [Rhizobium ruizarguesonis]